MPSLTVLVRPAVASDREALDALSAQLVRVHHDWDAQRFLQIRSPSGGYGPWLCKEATNADALVLVGEVETRVVGYLYARFEPVNYAALLGPHAALHDILVAPEARARGVATALIGALRDEAAARSVPRLVLHTAVQNSAGQALFRKLGFVTTMLEMTCEVTPH